jgi:hypothetical protein
VSLRLSGCAGRGSRGEGADRRTRLGQAARVEGRCAVDSGMTLEGVI